MSQINQHHPLNAKGAQGQINTLEDSIRSLEKENGNPKRAIIVEKKKFLLLCRNF